MNKFIAFPLSVLLGLVQSQAVSYAKRETLVVTRSLNNKINHAPHSHSSSLQIDFAYNSDQLAMPWDTVTLADNL